MDKRRVVIVSDNTLFAEGVRQLLDLSGRVDVAALLSPGEATRERVQELQPDMFILDNSHEKSSALLSFLLDSAPSVRVIRLDLGGNEVRIYNVCNVLARNAQEFTAILGTLPLEQMTTEKEF